MKTRQCTIRVLAWPIRSQFNPYTPLLYSNLGEGIRVDEFALAKLLGRYSVWHIHWPEALLNIRNPIHAAAKVACFFAVLDYLRTRGTKVIWTIHNCASHEKLYPALEARFWRRFIPRVDGVISLSWAGLSRATDSFPALKSIPCTVIPHGHYRGEYPSVNGHSRKMLGIPDKAKVLLFVGAVRSYKNVDVLIRTFRKTTADDTLLYVVGRPNTAQLEQSILREAASDKRINVLFDFISPQILSAYLNAANLVVLPYRGILNSGSALLALSLNRPILVPDLGAMAELRADFGEKWVHTYTAGELTKETLDRALEWSLEIRAKVCPIPEKYQWRNIGDETAHFYKTIIGNDPAPEEAFKQQPSQNGS